MLVNPAFHPSTLVTLGKAVWEGAPGRLQDTRLPTHFTEGPGI